MENIEFNDISYITFSSHATRNLEKRVLEYNDSYDENLSSKIIKEKICERLGKVDRFIASNEEFRINKVDYYVLYVVCDSFVKDNEFIRTVITIIVNRIITSGEKDRNHKRIHYARRDSDRKRNKFNNSKRR